jgi:hypothetical protein
MSGIRECPQEPSEEERYIRAALANGSLVALGGSAIKPLLDEIDRLRAALLSNSRVH